MKPEDRPIGYWLRELDHRIEAAFVRTLDGQGQGQGQGPRRRHWQVLDGPGPHDPFRGPGERPDEEVADLAARGRVAPDGSLTPDGGQARAAVAADVTAVRRRVADGIPDEIPDEDYLTTVRTLARMAESLQDARST